MIIRRRNGSVLGLVAACGLVIIILGIALFLLLKILGGAREAINSTDAGALKVARDSLTQISVPSTSDGKDFSDCAYPVGSNQITLLTYNRCVAKALVIALNASTIGGTAPANAGQWIQAVNDLGKALTAKLANADASQYGNMNQLNVTNMWGGNNVNQTGSTTVGYMKPGQSTNVYFPLNALPKGANIPMSTSSGSINPSNGIFTVPGGASAVSPYLAGYMPITVPNVSGTMFGVPVFPQQKPHLVSLTDFDQSLKTYGSAPCNAFKVNTKSKNSEANVFGGSVAAAIVGAISPSTVSASMSTTQQPFGSGFEYVPALSWGYVQFSNAPANPKPPGYNPDDYKENIFNNELLNGPMEASGFNSQGTGTQYNDTVMFSTSPTGTISNWLAWANSGGSGNPPAGTVYFGARGANLQPGYSAANPPSASAVATMKKISQSMGKSGGSSIDNCITQLDSEPGLLGNCVGDISAMEATFNHNLPNYAAPNPSPNFSQVDWAKATVIMAFETPGPNGAGTNAVNVNLDSTLISGLGVYQSGSQAFPVAQYPNIMPVPTVFTMPLEQPGSIYDLIRTVQTAGCVTDTVSQITSRCLQIQPKTNVSDVKALLQSTIFPMSPAGSTNPNYMYIYLPGGDLTKKLVCNAGPPSTPGFSSSTAPDGAAGSSSCYQNKYYLNQLLVDSPNDQGVHMEPFTQMQPPDVPSGLYVLDQASWQPGSGSNNCMGLMTFQEIGLGTTKFLHIN